MDEGRDSALATGLQLAVVAGCVGAVAVAVTAPGAVLGEGIGARLGGVTAQTNGGLVAGGLLAVIGVVSLIVRGRRLTGWSAVVLGVAWTAASGRGLLHVPAILPVVAVGSAPIAAVLLPIATTVMAGRPATPRARRAALLAAAVALVLGAIAVAAYDPFDDPTCVEGCDHGAPLLDLSLGARQILDDTIAVGSGAMGGLTVALTGWALVSRKRDARARRLMLLGCLLAGTGLVIDAALTVAAFGPAGPAGTARSIVATLAGLGPVLLAAGLAWTVVDVVRLRTRVSRVADLVALASPDGTWKKNLAEALGDRSLAIAYQLVDGSGSIDAAGEPADVAETDERLLTTVERRGQPVARIGHRRSLDPAAVRAELTPAVLVALDNERLRAISLASLRTLRESRARIVAVEDDERRRIERDLHDGAQQRLLAIAFELRLERTGAERHGDAAAVERLIRAEGLAFAALAELRRVARGVHPAILGQGGLAPALSSLAEEAPVPMTLEIDRTRRWPALVEMTAYQVVAEAMSDAAAAGSSELAVVVDSADDEVILEIAIDGRTPAPYPVRIADRVGATGGAVTVDQPAGGPMRIRAVMPCA
jgi:signal transduction histidine kinase